MITQLDQPQPGSKHMQVYRLHIVEAQSVADLFKSSFSDIAAREDKDLNAITVFATASEQQRIAGAVNVTRWRFRGTGDHDVGRNYGYTAWDDDGNVSRTGR